MEITEISDAIQNALRKEKFVGDFEVTIYHPYMPNGVKITGYKNCNLQSKINEICFKIDRGDFPDGGFSFEIKGQIEHLYKCYGVEK